MHYPITERIQTLRRPKADPGARRVLIAYSFPDDLWGRLVDQFRTRLQHHGIDARVPPTKSAHVSVGLLVDPSDHEVEQAVQIEVPSFRIQGVEPVEIAPLPVLAAQTNAPGPAPEVRLFATQTSDAWRIAALTRLVNGL